MYHEAKVWGRLPDYNDINKQLDVVYDEVTTAFDDLVASGVELIDKDFELQYPLFKDYTDMIAGWLGHGDDIVAEQTVYRAVQFAYLCCEQIENQPVLNPKLYFEIEPEADQGTRIRSDTQLYFQHRPVLDAFVGRYMHEIDRTGKYPHLAETAAAVTFMQLEIPLRQAAIDRSVEAFVSTIDDLE